MNRWRSERSEEEKAAAKEANRERMKRLRSERSAEEKTAAKDVLILTAAQSLNISMKIIITIQILLINSIRSLRHQKESK